MNLDQTAVASHLTPPDLAYDAQDPADKSELDFSLPAVQMSDRHFDGILDNNLSYVETCLLIHCLGNMHTKTGVINQFTVSELSSRLKVSPGNFYGRNGYIARLNATKMVKLEIKHHKVCGKVCEPPNRRLRNKKYPSKYPLKVTVWHREALRLMLPLSKKNTVLRLFLALSFHCDKQTGKLNTFKTAEQWGAICGGFKRINCDRAIDYLSDIGVCAIRRDYIVKGGLPFVAIGQAFLNIRKAQEKDRRKEEAIEKKASPWDYKQIERDLLYFFGINATGWGKTMLEQAYRKIVKWMSTQGYTEFKKVKKRLQDENKRKPDPTRGVGDIPFSDAPSNWASVG